MFTELCNNTFHRLKFLGVCVGGGGTVFVLFIVCLNNLFNEIFLRFTTEKQMLRRHIRKPRNIRGYTHNL